MASSEEQHIAASQSQPYRLTPRSGLVLEGGGMRGVFTCGVLDAFMDRGIRFPYTIGVSAGACNGLSYLSGQRGRAKYSNIDLLERYRYISLKNWILKGNIMDFDLLFDAFPNRIIPYDYAALKSCKERFEMVTTNCLTGEACYFEEREDPERIIQIVKASSSLPYLSPIVKVEGIPMLDGGIADSLPLERARALGYDHNLVVLTRNYGYRKSDKPLRLPPFIYRKYPRLREAIRSRNLRYNSQIAHIEELEARGEVVVIRPERPIQVDRIERNTHKLLDLYDEGYAIASRLRILPME